MSRSSVTELRPPGMRVRPGDHPSRRAAITKSSRPAAVIRAPAVVGAGVRPGDGLLQRLMDGHRRHPQFRAGQSITGAHAPARPNMYSVRPGGEPRRRRRFLDQFVHHPSEARPPGRGRRRIDQTDHRRHIAGSSRPAPPRAAGAVRHRQRLRDRAAPAPASRCGGSSAPASRSHRRSGREAGPPPARRPASADRDSPPMPAGSAHG